MNYLKILITLEMGFAISEQELEEQINAGAALIFDQENHPIASIAVAGPAYRLIPERMMEFGPHLVAIAKEISQDIKIAAIPLTNSAADIPDAIENSN